MTILLVYVAGAIVASLILAWINVILIGLSERERYLYQPIVFWGSFLWPLTMPPLLLMLFYLWARRELQRRKRA